MNQYPKEFIQQQIRDNQNLSLGAMAGFVAAIVGAAVWGLVSYFTGYQIGWIAVGIGFVVGFAIRKVGQGVDQSFGIMGALFALVGCLMGNLLSSCIHISNVEEVSLSDVLNRLDLSLVVEIYKVSFSPVDIVFYGLALYYGYKYSIVVVEPEAKIQPDQNSPVA